MFANANTDIVDAAILIVILIGIVGIAYVFWKKESCSNSTLKDHAVRPILSTKQVIVWRHDLQCRLGKKMAQASHASLAHLSTLIHDNVDEQGSVSFKLTPHQLNWHLGNFKKIVLRVESEAELMIIYEKAKELGITCELITDSGLTEWKVPTRTCLALGPDNELKIDEITGENGPLGKLKLL